MSSTVTFSGSGELTQSIVNASIGSATSVIIDGYSSIGNSAFNGKTLITSVTIPNSVTSIGGSVFNGCSALTNIIIPNSVKSINTAAFFFCSKLTSVTLPTNSLFTTTGNQVFQGCSSLTTITIPNSVTSIGSNAFNGCSALTTITIPNRVTSIGASAFLNCTALSSVTFEPTSKVTSIGSNAFQNCTALTSVTIPNSVTSIGNSAFQNCTALTSITVSESNSNYSSLDGVLFNKLRTTLIVCPGGKTGSYTIPNSVTSISGNAFYGCTALTSITVSESNSNYSSLDGVLFNKLRTTLIVCPGGKTGSYTIPNSVTSISGNAFYGCTALTSVTFEPTSKVTSIDSIAFQNCTALTSVTIPNSVTSIGSSAFSGCTTLTSVTIPNSVTSIDTSAFQNCSGLTSVIIPDSVQTIGSNTFRSCSALASIIIPSSVQTIGDSAFAYTAKLTDIFVDSNNNNFSSLDGVLFNKNQTTLIQYPTWNSITSYTVPSTVSTISNRAFGLLNYSDNKLTSVILNNTLASIQSFAFRFCLFTSIIIPNSVTTINSSAFFGCSALTSITIPDSVTSIGSNAFQNCTALTSVTIPDSVTSIGGEAFQGCSGLTTVYIANGQVISGTTFVSPASNVSFFGATVATTTYIHQNFYLTEEFDVSANNITAAIFDAEDTTDVSGNYPNKAEIRVEKNVIQNMFQYWTDAIDMSNAVVSDIFYRVNYTDSAVPLSPDFVVGAIMTASDPNMNPDSNLTNYLPQDYLRYLAKKLFNTTRGVDLFANETEVLQSVNTRCRVGLNQILLTYLDANANGIIRDEDDFIILDPYDPVEVAGSQKVTGNPAKKIMKQILSNDPARFVDISSNYAVAGQTYWYKMPIEVGDNLYFPVTIKAPTDQQKLTQPDSTTLIEDRTYLIRCVVVADGSIPSPYNVYSYSALPSLTTFYH
jgi:hypothetical protein